MIQRSLLALVGVLAALPAAGQPAHSYSAEPIIIRHAETVWEMKADGTGSQTDTMAVTVQSDAAVRQFGVVASIYARQSQRTEFVYVHVRHADGTVAETPLDGVQEQAAPVTREAPFYSDIMIKQLPVKALRVGDTLEWQTHTTRTTAEAPNQFWGEQRFARDVVVEEQKIELRVPTGSTVNVWTNPESKVRPVEADANGEHSYRWEWKQLEPTAGPDAEALKKAKKDKPLTPEELEDASEGSLADLAWSTFPDWEAVGAWYRSLEAERILPDASVKAKVAEITAGKTTERQKVEAVYAWVSGQIRYIGVSLGIGRYQPHAASAVLDNQYGDCKDKHTLLAAMLTALGLHPDAVLAGAGVRFNRGVPSPGAFNHLFTHLAVGGPDGKEVWLDSTSEVAAYGVLTQPVRDKQVLVVPDQGPARLERTPAKLPFVPQSTFAVAGSLDGSLASDSSVTLTMHDDVEVALRSALRQVSPGSYNEFVEQMMASFGFGGKVTEAEIDHANDPAQPLVVRFHYHRVKEESWGENRVTATFFPILLPSVDEKDLPRAPLELGLERTETSTIEMKLPQGWSMELPEAVHAHSAAANCDVVYRIENGSLHAERKLTVLESRLPVDQMKTYAAWYKDCGASGVPFLQLMNGPGYTTVASNTSEAAKLVASANQKILLRDYDGAAKDLEEAKSKDASQRDLWGDLGAVAMHRNDTKEAMRLYSKEIELHPESTFAYANLARLQRRTGDPAGELRTEEGWIRSAPGRPQVASQALAFAMSGGDQGAALRIAHVVESVLPEESKSDEHLRLQMGEAELHAGDAGKGVEMLTSLVKGSKDTLYRNDADYELAVAGKELPLVEQAQRGVLDELAEESRNWTGDEAPALLGQRSSLMQAAWDTMGWILFKEGKAQEAEGWIQAAWNGRQNAEIGEHMADVLVAEEKPGKAIQYYRWALSFPALAGSPEGSPVRKRIQAKLDAAERGYKPPPGPPNSRDSLQRMRMIPLGPSNGASRMCTFYLLLSPTGVVKAKPLPGESNTELSERLKDLKPAELFPPKADARLMREGTVNCHQAVCELIYAP